jgi:SAM-dependent methyltransferase
MATINAATAARFCNICGWAGDRFDGVDHVESNQCPACGSIARDRFVSYLALSRGAAVRGSSVIETSPRLGQAYRRYMKRMYTYLSTDFDQSAHIADIFMDIQKMDLASNSIDTFITSHVLEHVPDTHIAASELFRVVKPGGTAVVAIPLLNGTTCVPTEPEYHGDNTLVFWRFGWDLREILAAAGFTVEVAVTAAFADLLRTKQWDGPVSSEFDLPSILSVPVDVVSCMDAPMSARLGINPPYQFVGFICSKPAVRPSL